MRRREFIAGAFAAALAARASAQTSPATRRLAVFIPTTPTQKWRREAPGAMLEEIKRLKYVEGDNLKVEYYGKEENTSGLDALAARVVASKPDVIYVDGVGGPLFKRLTATTPIVVLSSDLIGQGLVKSLAHPGGNITGVAVDAGPAVWGNARNGHGVDEAGPRQPGGIQGAGARGPGGRRSCGDSPHPHSYQISGRGSRLSRSNRSRLTPRRRVPSYSPNTPKRSSTRACSPNSPPRRGFPRSIPSARTSKPAA